MLAQKAEKDWRDRAVESRDPTAEGLFVLGVVTTGIYCRPGCPARTPRPENRRYFATTADAQAAGFRACLRCKPDSAPEDPIARVCRFMGAAESLPSLTEMAAVAGLSPHHFHRAFKATTGVTPRAWAAARRAERLHEALVAGSSVTQAIHAAGYETSGRAYAEASARLGMNPARVRERGRGEAIRAGVAMTSLGPLLVAATERGVVRLAFGEEADLLLMLQRDFEAAVIQTDDPEFAALLAVAVSLVDEPEAATRLPLDIRGTAFQQQVWQALTAIPPGTTATYGQVARAIGRPAAVRAVAAACAANDLAIAIPCHRVVPASGGTGGYRWGTKRKAALLKNEGAIS